MPPKIGKTQSLAYERAKSAVKQGYPLHVKRLRIKALMELREHAEIYISAYLEAHHKYSSKVTPEQQVIRIEITESFHRKMKLIQRRAYS